MARLRLSESLLLVPLLFLLLSAPISCGKKGPPALPVHEKPPPPSALSAIHREGEILLSWRYPGEKLSSIEGFTVMRAEDGGFENLAFTKERAYTDREFALGKSYRYMVVARDLRGTRSETSEEVRAMPAPVPPPPVGVSFEILKDSVRLSWTHPDEGVLFNMYRSREEGAYPLEPLNQEPVRGLYFEDRTNTEETVYYTVRALRGGSLRDEGPPSAEVGIGPGDYVPSRPTGLKAVLLDDRVVLLWEENPETWVRGYRVYRAGQGGEPEAIGESQTPTFTDRGMTEGKASYMISAVGPVREGLPSGPLEVGPR